VLHCEYQGTIPGLPAMHGLQVLYLRGDQMVVVTASSGQKRWPEYEAVLRKLMSELQIAE
jgi:hypothetical protein